MSLHLPYGKGVFTVDTGGTPITTLHKETSVQETESEIIASALRSPMGTAPLRSLAEQKGAAKAVIVVSDITRRTGAQVFMPHLMRQLPDLEITVLFALGQHRAMRAEEIDEILGVQVRRRVRVLQHDAQSPEDLLAVGETTRGTPVIVNRVAMESDLLILTGAAAYHSFAGFGGGPKSVLPGICAAESIRANHQLVLNDPPGEGMNPQARAGIADGNPVHEDMLEACQLVQPDFLLNTICGPDGRLVGACAGDPLRAHQAVCRQVEQMYGVPLSRRSDLVLVSAGGFPRDISFYQATKALSHSERAVNDGGTIILVAECAEGIGPASHEFWFGALQDEREIDRELRRNFEIIGYMALEIAHLRNRRGLRLVTLTHLSHDQCVHVGMEKINGMGVQDLVSEAQEAIVMPSGSDTLPVIG